MIRIDMTRRELTGSRAVAQVGGERFETVGNAPIYKMSTLLYLKGHAGEPFEVYDDIDPFDGPGGLALTGHVRSYAVWKGSGWSFGQYGEPDPDLNVETRELIAAAALS